MMDTISDADIRALREEARLAGDEAMASLAQAVLNGEDEGDEFELVRDAVLANRLAAVWIGEDLAVRDPKGGIWWPSSDALEQAEDDSALDIADALVAICRAEPGLGRWSS